MQAVILAAGISTRLRPLTDNLPKPMLPVRGRPMMEYIVRQLVSHSIKEIFVTTHYCADRIREYFGNGQSFGARIVYSHEDVLMNTAGSLKLLQNVLNDDFIVIGGNDFLPSIDLHAFAAFHKARDGIGTIAFKNLENSALLSLFGQGVLDNSRKLVRFVEKPEQKISTLIHTTYQIYTPRALEYVPAGVPCSIPEYLIRRLLMASEHIYGYVTESPFICISTRDQYEQAHDLIADENISAQKE